MSLHPNSPPPAAKNLDDDSVTPGNWSYTDREILLKVAAIEHTVHLIDALKAADKDVPDRTQHKFQFMQLSGLAIPDAVRELQDTGLIDLTMTRERHQPIDFSLEFHSDSGGHTLMTSRTAETDPTSAVDLAVFPTDRPVNPDNIRTFSISAADINKLIMSMVEVTKTGRYDNATAYNLHDPDMLIPLATVLSERADRYEVNVTYSDLDDDGLALTYTASTGFESNTTDFSVRCPTNWDGSRCIVMYVDMQKDLQVTYVEELVTGTSIETSPLIPDIEDLAHIRDRVTSALERFQIKPLSIDDPFIGDEADTGEVVS